MSPNSSSTCLRRDERPLGDAANHLCLALPRVAIGGRGNSTPCSLAAPPVNPRACRGSASCAQRRWYRGAIVRGRLRVLSPGAGGAAASRAVRRPLPAIAASLSAAGLAAVASGCGGSPATAGEPSKTFHIEVVRASFPAKQAVAQARAAADDGAQPQHAKRSRTSPSTRRLLPLHLALSANSPRTRDPSGSSNAAPARSAKPPVETQEVSIPGGGQTAYVNTWALGAAARRTHARPSCGGSSRSSPGAYKVHYAVRRRARRQGQSAPRRRRARDRQLRRR